MMRFICLGVFLQALLSPVWAAGQTVTVFAAASLQGALEEIAEGYHHDVRVSYAGSGTLARQIAAQAPADVVILASQAWLDWLIDLEVVAGEDALDVASNRLVVIGQRGSDPLATVEDLPTRLGTSRLAMGHRDAVPAGVYARQWLMNTGQWDDIADQLAETDNVRAALALVARGQVPMGIVYASDARAEGRVDVISQVPDTLHDDIRYPGAALNAAGADFLAYLTGDDAQDIFALHGFLKAHR
ncbi:MAG: molybdate ABC transporter substrate-binding protein [Pseudomonadota bacterium]